ncbi:MAG: protein translocase subunit SecD, partial [Propionibacteriaceae bacterium]|nr:protein translocase subunit SecD [Propionibacteriaceae bacterium]
MPLIGFFSVTALLALIMVLSGSWTPKLGLDLRGGSTIILTASNVSGSGSVDSASLEQARTIIQQRVDGLGVGEAEITTSGSNQIQVSAPNVQQDELVEMVGQTAQLAFRKVYAVQQADADPPAGQAVALPSVPADFSDRPSEPTTTLPASEDVAGRQALLTEQLAWTPSDQDNSDFSKFQCGDNIPDVWDQPLFACLRADVADGGYQVKYLLGPRLIEGDLVDQAQAGMRDSLTWAVQLSFSSLGGTLFADATADLALQTSPMNQFAIVLDSDVISAPSVSARIPDGSAEITGSFNQSTATNLANVLKYGALPLAFELSNVDTVSATLGADQLQAGLIAGGIGLLLVILYSFL